MKPRSLRLQQFGPYTDHVVNFEPFIPDGLFLIHGDTGSGKSVLLDAICFALFGRGLGARDGEDELRNKTAPPEEPSAVTLEFTLGARRYRVHRAMAHERASRRGGGLTRQPAEALIECAEGDSSFESVTAPAKVTRAVERLLGLERSQFCRIIVLPQGEFRELLLTKAEEREKLLEQIFGGELYKSVERALHEMHKQAEQSVLALGERTESLLSSVGATSPGELWVMRAAVEASLTALRAELESLSSALAESLTELERARAAMARNLRRRALDESLTALAANSERAAGQRAEAEAAARADGCLAAISALERAKSARDGALGAASSAEAELSVATLALGRDELRPSAAAAMELERVGLAARCERLEALCREVERAAAQALELEEARRASEGARASLVAATERCEANAVERAALAEERARRFARAQGEGRAALRRQELSQRLEAARVRVELDGRWAELARVVRESERRVQAAEVMAREARERRSQVARECRAAMAVELAQDLVPGRACAVCGSEQHPRVATGTEALVEQGALRAADEALALAEGGFARASARHARELGELAGLDAQRIAASAVDRATEREIQAALAEAQRELAQAQEARREAEVIDTRCAELAREWEAAQPRLVELSRTVAALEARGGTLRERASGAEVPLQEGLAGLEEARRAMAAVDAEIAVGQRERAMWSARRAAAQGALAGARRALGASEEALVAACGELSRVLAAQAFLTIEDALSARRDEAQYRALRRGVIAHDSALEGVGVERAGLGEAEREGDIVALEERCACARRALEEAQQSVGALRERSFVIGRLCERVEAGGAERAQREQALARVRKVADLANGRSEGRVRLSRYVLLDQFDRVTEAASARLDVMSDGRFRLSRRENSSAGREFELMVEDAYTGAAERSAATLSGGEMFLASLALALGLSDVVQQHAGGVRIESLFVDEGFGSLDEESLDKAVMVLEQLQANGRLVGVVSHVPELRKRIVAKLEVLRADGGSITRAGARLRAKLSR